MTPSHAALGYHLWLAPEGAVLQRLQHVVVQLAEKYDGPVFAPHVTLLSGLRGDEGSLIEANRTLADGLPSFELSLTKAEAGHTFFQCVYMRVAEDPSLSEMRRAAGEVFALPSDGYMPHLSLYYGDVSEERRATIVADIPRQAACRFPVASIQLIRADSERPRDWHCVDKAPLTS